MSITTSSEGNTISLLNCGSSGCDPFPIVDRLWEIYSEKGIRTVFFSIGSSLSAMADLDLAETLGCPLHIVPLSEEEKEDWKKVTTILANRKGVESEATGSFIEGVEKKWVLPKNLRIQAQLPWWTKGGIDISGNGHIPTIPALEAISTACSKMKLKEDSIRLDILKIDTQRTVPKLAGQVALSILESGFRPSILLIHWGASPDIDIPSSIHAGCIQTMGYKLLGKKDNKFLYYYTDVDMFQCCSWEDTTCNNPMIQEIMKALRPA